MAEQTTRGRVPLADSPDALFHALADRRRRTVLSVLADRDAPLDETALAARVADRDGDDERRVRTTLRHGHLPKLADAGLVVRDDGAVRATDRAALDGLPDAPAVARALADGRRRDALTVLKAVGRPLDERALAARVAALAGGDADADRMLATLRHVHLPRLVDAGLAVRDRDAGTVAFDGRADVAARWFVEPFLAGGVRTLVGRERVAARAQEVMADADDELFALVTAADVLEPGCLDGMRAAAERGVDVFVGAGSPAARERVRNRVPDARVWEPGSPDGGACDRLGRLVVADRRAVVVGTRGSTRPDGRPAETAVTGAESDSAVVVLVRDLLESRLDRRDGDGAVEIPL